MLFAGKAALTQGVTEGIITFDLTLAAAPNVILPVVQNTSADSPKLLISAWAVNITSTGFTYKLEAAPNSDNYELVYLAGDPGLFNSSTDLGIPAESLPAIVAQVTGYSSCYITEWDVRKYVSDHEMQRGQRGAFDLDFAPSTIASAMESAAREYNGIPPYVGRVSAAKLPKVDNSFLDAIAYFLYLMKLQEEQRHDTPYTAGNVSVDVAARRVAHFTEATKMFYERFFSATKIRKKLRNVSLGYRRIG